MSSNIAPVLAGLVIGLGFIMLFSSAINSLHLPKVKISEEQAVGIAIQDLTTEYIKNPVGIKIYTIIEHGNAEYIPVEEFPKEGNWPLVLVYSHPAGTFYLVDARTYAVEECHIPYCPLPEQGMQAIEGRLGWIVDLVARCENFPQNTTVVIYTIDAETGEIIFHYGDPQPEQTFVCS